MNCDATSAVGTQAGEVEAGDGVEDAGVVDRLVATLGAAVPRLRRAYDLEAALAAATRGAVDTVPGVDRAGISILESDGVLTSRAPTDEQVAELDRLQSQCAEGPSVRALSEGEHPVWIHDLAAEAHRWPRFAPRALELGAASVLSFRLSADDAPLSALNLYAATASAFGQEARLAGELFASHATIAVSHARNNDHLTVALNTRDVIGQAKGILQERFGITDSEAFTKLVESSQHSHLKLAQVARWLTGHHEQPN